MNKYEIKLKLNKAVPWMAGAGFALGHIAISTNCTLTTQGRCISCGGCVIALASLVGWARLQKKKGDFYIAGQDAGK